MKRLFDLVLVVVLLSLLYDKEAVDGYEVTLKHIRLHPKAEREAFVGKVSANKTERREGGGV